MQKIYIVGEDCGDGSTSLRYFTDPALRELFLDYFAESFSLSEINNDSFECENFSEPMVTPEVLLAKLVIREHGKLEFLIEELKERYFPTYESIPEITLKIEELKAIKQVYFIAKYYLGEVKLVNRTFSSMKDAQASLNWFKEIY
jgi:hypothetical protein